MISIDKSKQLKELGLQWEPQEGDWYKPDYWYDPVLLKADTIRLTDKENVGRFKRISEDEKTIWLPRLDQLLIEIEKLGYYPRIEKWDDSLYECDPCINGVKNEPGVAQVGFKWDQAAADVLIYLLEHQNKS